MITLRIVWPYWQMLILNLRKPMIYNEDEVDELIMLIRYSFIPAFTVLKETLMKKLEVIGSKINASHVFMACVY